MATPICRDYFVELGTAASYDFTIYDSDTSAGNIIYQGRAYNRGVAGTDAVTIYVNDICAGYLKAELANNIFFANGFKAEDIRRKFSVYVGTTLIDDFSFYLDYAYDGVVDRTDDGIANAPIIHRIQANQPFVMTNYKNSGGVLTFGTSTSGTLSSVGHYHFRPTAAQEGTTVTAAWKDGSDIIDSIPIAVMSTCHKYALYYLNKFGGWDTLLIEGKAIETETNDYERYAQDYSNDGNATGYFDERGDTVLANTLRRSWQLNTGWLTDEESRRMPHLLTSTTVFLADLSQSILYAVNITNGECPIKTYKNQRSLVSYQIDVERAVTETRR